MDEFSKTASRLVNRSVSEMDRAVVLLCQIRSTRFAVWLEEVAADEFEGMLAGPEADALAVTGEIEFFDLGVATVG